MTFSGFPASDLAWLCALAAHNERDWFTANRATYDTRLKPGLEALIEATSAACAARDVPLGGEAKRSVFRIHRDVRFSKDKRPYKTHVSGTLTRDGGKLSPGMMYVHIEPQGGPYAGAGFDADSIEPLDPSTHPSARPGAAAPAPIGEAGDAMGLGPFVAVGFYLHERPNIEAFRRAIVADPDGWTAIRDRVHGRGLGFAPGAPTKRMPRGFEAHAGGPLEQDLKRSQWFVRRPLTAAEVEGAALPEALADFAADLMPLLRFGWAALDSIRHEPAKG